MIDAKDYRNNRITVFDSNGNVAKVYDGKIYIYFGDKAKDGCIHFVDEEGLHHRIYGEGLVTIDEF